MSAARRWIVRGVVQGVGYRAFTQSAAETIGVVGEVKNLRNGTVEVLAEGEPDQLDRLEGRLREGPWGSRVEAVEAEDRTATGEYERFSITY